MKRCLYCYQFLQTDVQDFHPGCSRKLFGTPTPPELSFAAKDMRALASQVIQSQFSITGAQPKLSLDVDKTASTQSGKFTIVGLWGNFILKPPSESYTQLPEVEDLTMHLATIARINVVPHSLIRMKDGNPAYITRRIDRSKKRKKVTKFHMEDMCQLTGRLTADKYNGSYEQIAKAIWKFSSRPVLDIVNFYEQVLFSFLTGNADMHLKNFSLINKAKEEYILAPAYDLVSTALVIPEDKEDLALTLHGRKRKLDRNDFISAFKGARLDDKQQFNIFRKMENAKDEWFSFIDISFLNPECKTKYKEIIQDRFNRLHT
jgi:serine/threonine-protein kinase HipA